MDNVQPFIPASGRAGALVLTTLGPQAETERYKQVSLSGETLSGGLWVSRFSFWDRGLGSEVRAVGSGQRSRVRPGTGGACPAWGQGRQAAAHGQTARTGRPFVGVTRNISVGSVWLP